MNQFENSEIHDLRHEITSLREYVEGKIRWFIGLAVTVLLASGIWLLSQHEANIRTNEIATEARKLAERNGAALTANGREVSGIVAKLESQTETLERIDDSIAELTRYLRGGPRP